MQAEPMPLKSLSSWRPKRQGHLISIGQKCVHQSRGWVVQIPTLRVFFDWRYPNVPGVHAADNNFTETLLYFCPEPSNSHKRINGICCWKKPVFLFLSYFDLCLLLLFWGVFTFGGWGVFSVVKPTIMIWPRLHKTISTEQFARIHRVLNAFRQSASRFIHSRAFLHSSDSVLLYKLFFFFKPSSYVRFFPLSAMANSAWESDLERVTLTVYGFC